MKRVMPKWVQPWRIEAGPQRLFDVTQEEFEQIEHFIRESDSWPGDASSFGRRCDEELAKMVNNIPSNRELDAWILNGLDCLADMGYGMYVNRSKGQRPGDFVLNVVSEDPELSAQDIALMKKWVNQTSYELWKKIQHIEELMIDEVRDGLIGLVLGEESGKHLGEQAIKQWNKIIAKWVDENG